MKIYFLTILLVLFCADADASDIFFNSNINTMDTTISITKKSKPRNYWNPYKIILRKKIVDGFAEFSKGNYKPLLALYADDVHQKFEGNHALGGERYSKDKVEQWFQRFVRLIPSKFTITDVIVQGMPWNTVAIVEFQDAVAAEGVEPYVNNGIMNAKIKWGKAKDVHIYVDTQKIIHALNTLKNNGIEEAGAAPIE